MAVSNPPNTGFSDAADRSASSHPIQSTSLSWTQTAPLPESYEAYAADFEASRQDIEVEADTGLIDDEVVAIADPLGLPDSEQLQVIADQAAIDAIHLLRSHKA
jgi:hypothetical protein